MTGRLRDRATVVVARDGLVLLARGGRVTNSNVPVRIALLCDTATFPHEGVEQ